VWVSLSHLASQCAAALFSEAGKYHLFGLARGRITPEDEKRQLCELHEVVSTCDPDGIRNSNAQPVDARNLDEYVNKSHTSISVGEAQLQRISGPLLNALLTLCPD